MKQDEHGIAIVDYGVGNRASIANMLMRLGVAHFITDDPVAIAKAKKVILPGVGAFDAGMKNLIDRGLVKPIVDAAGRGVPILGICLGMQLLCAGSEEGEIAGLGLIAGRSRKFQLPPDERRLKIPHVGWAEVDVVRPGRLFRNKEERHRYYFTHSFHVTDFEPDDLLANARHGMPFAAALEHGLIFGVQFHPEKSHRFGMSLLREFSEIVS